MTRTETFIPDFPVANLSPGHTHPFAAANPRQGGHEVDIESLMHTLHEQGVLQPLRAFPKEDGSGEGWVYIGERRLLASQKNIGVHSDARTTVPVIWVEGISAEEAFRESLVEQVNRLPLHPIDQFEAFANLFRTGMSEAAIADYYTIPKQVVRQRIALGEIAPEIRAAWRAGEVDEDCAKEFTRLTSHKDQYAAFKRLKKIHQLDARSVRSSLVPDQGRGAALVNFVGLDAYRERGGQVYEDLFNGLHGVSDAALAQLMADERLESEAQRLVTFDGWSWAKPASAMPAMWRHYDRSQPKSSVTVDEQKRLDAITERLETEELDDAAHDALRAEYDGIKQSADLRAFSARQKAKSGCVVSVSLSGELSVEPGIILPDEPVKEEKPAGDAKAAAPGKSSPGDTDSELPAAPKLSNAQASDLAVTLTEAGALSVAGNFNLAMAIALAALDMNTDGLPARLRHNGMGRNTLKLSKQTTFADKLQEFLKLKPQQRETLFAQVVAASLQFDSHTAEHHAMTDKDIATLVDAVDPKVMVPQILKRFDQEVYFQKAPKAFALSAIGDVMGKAEAKFSDTAAKGEMVEYAIANCPPAKWLPVELRPAGYTGPGAKKPKGAASPPAKAATAAKKKSVKKKK